MITQRQKDVLEFLKMRIASAGVAPSYDEIKDHVGLASKSGVFRIIRALEDRGYLKLKYNKARSIELTDKAAVEFFDGKASHDLLVAVCQLEGAASFIPEELRAQIVDYHSAYTAAISKNKLGFAS